MLYLDTNAYSALANGKAEIIEMLKGYHEICLPLPVIAELQYGFINGSQKDKNQKVLDRFLAQANVSVVGPTINTAKIYAEFQNDCVKRGKALSHNDLWIASIVKESKNGILITYDQDFIALKEALINQLFVFGDN